jgi:hypothetical protein
MSDGSQDLRMPHKRSRSSLERREARRRALREAFWDRERMEAVSLTSYPEVSVSQGEVLYTGRGFISPSIALDPYMEAYCWLRAMGLSAKPSSKS